MPDIFLTVQDSFLGTTIYSLQHERGEDGEAVYVARVTHRDQVLKKYNETEKVIRTFTAAEMAPFLAVLRNMPVAICPEGMMGLDGRNYTITVDVYQIRSQFRWWMGVPGPWRALESMWKLFEADSSLLPADLIPPDQEWLEEHLQGK